MNPSVATTRDCPSGEFGREMIQHLQQIGRGDMKGFDAFVNAYKMRIYGYLVNRMSNAHLAEDATQEVFLRAFRAARVGTAPTQSVQAWLFTIAANLVRDHYRRKGRSREQFVDQPPDVVDQSACPAGRLERSERQAVVRREIDRLPEEQKAVL